MSTLLGRRKRSEQIEALLNFPKELDFLRSKKPEDLNAQYRPGSWTVLQIVHHLCDSHLNAYIRFKWALTEDMPQIKAYDQDGWNQEYLLSGRSLEDSLEFLEIIHRIWAQLMKSMRTEDWRRQYDHPEHNGLDDLESTLELYVWHGAHHLKQINKALQ